MTSDWMPRGLYVPMVTPFDEGGAVDVEALEELCHGVLSAGAAGVVALATTGEASGLDTRERDAVLATCADVCGSRGAELIVGAGTSDTRSTIERHEQLASHGCVTAALTVVPYYVRPSEAGIVEHFKAVAGNSALPIVIYNIPYRTGRRLSAAGIVELAQLPNIVGVKQSVGTIDGDTLELLRRCPADFAVLAGDDGFVCPMTLMGGHGAVTASAHVATAAWVNGVAAALAGDVAEALRIHDLLLPVSAALFAEPSPAVIKGLLHRGGAIPSPHVRLPLTDASLAAIDTAADALARAACGAVTCGATPKM